MANMFELDKDSSNMLLRLLFFGAPKTRKTWLAGTAAEAGFNTILLDFDKGYQILKQLSPEAKKRLTVIEASDNLRQAMAAEFMTFFLKAGRAFFDEKEERLIKLDSQVNDDCIELNINRHLNKNTVLIIDSYTALVKSINFRYAIEKKIDLTDPAKTDWDGYAWTGALATWLLEKISNLPCHTIIIGHQTMYEKKKDVELGNGKTKSVTEFSRLQIKSTSGPHSMTISDIFTDILYFENMSSITTKIDTRADRDKEGGSRIIPPASYDWNKLQFKQICEYAGIPLPDQSLPYLDFKPVIQGGAKIAETTPAKTISNKGGLTAIKALQKK